MTNNTEEFLTNNDYNPADFILKQEKIIRKEKEIDYLVHTFKINSDEVLESVCVEDILGFEDEEAFYDRDLVKCIKNAFALEGVSYKEEQLNLLSLSKEKIMNHIKTSFLENPVTLQEVNKDKYLIKDEGYLRFLILKFYFIKETLNFNKSSDEYNKVRNKYSFQALCTKPDYFKTYSRVILSLFKDLDYDIKPLNKSDHDNNSLKFIKDKKDEVIITNEILLGILKNLIISKGNDEIFSAINFFRKKSNQFSKYIDDNFSDIEQLKNINIKTKKLFTRI